MRPIAHQRRSVEFNFNTCCGATTIVEKNNSTNFIPEIFRLSKAVLYLKKMITNGFQTGLHTPALMRISSNFVEIIQLTVTYLYIVNIKLHFYNI